MNGRDWRFFGRLHTKLYNRLGGRFVDSVCWGRKVQPSRPRAEKAASSQPPPSPQSQQRDTLLVPKHPKPLRFSGKDRSG